MVMFLFCNPQALLKNMNCPSLILCHQIHLLKKCAKSSAWIDKDLRLPIVGNRTKLWQLWLNWWKNAGTPIQPLDSLLSALRRRSSISDEGMKTSKYKEKRDKQLNNSRSLLNTTLSLLLVPKLFVNYVCFFLTYLSFNIPKHQRKNIMYIRWAFFHCLFFSTTPIWKLSPSVGWSRRQV